MPVLPCRSLAGLPRYAAGYSGMMELAALCGVPDGVVLGRGTPFFTAPSRSAGIGFGPRLFLSVLIIPFVLEPWPADATHPRLTREPLSAIIKTHPFR